MPRKTRDLAASDTFGLRILFMHKQKIHPQTLEKTDVFYYNMQPVLCLLRGMGALPIRISPDGQRTSSGEGETFHFTLISTLVVLWSLCVYIALLTCLWFAYSEGFIASLSSQAFETVVIGYLDIAYHLIDIAVPFNNWREAKQVQAYVTNWTAFQLQYSAVTGRSLHVNFRCRAVLLCIVLVTTACARETMYQVMEENLHNYLVLITYMYQSVLRDIMCLSWYCLCLLLQKTAEEFVVSFQEDVDRAVYPNQVISCYKVLWLQFSQLVRQTGMATCYTYGFYVLYLFFMLTVSLYGLITTLMEGIKKRLVYLVCDSLVTATELFIVCDGANSVTRQVGLIFQEKLLDIKNSPTSDNTDKEIQDFLQTINLQPPEVNFGGYVTLNRGMLLSLGSMMVTYLVVLLQFEMSTTSLSSSGAPNSTNQQLS